MSTYWLNIRQRFTRLKDFLNLFTSHHCIHVPRLATKSCKQSVLGLTFLRRQSGFHFFSPILMLKSQCQTMIINFSFFNRGNMFQGRRPCFASKVCWVRFPFPPPNKSNIEKSMLENIQVQLNGEHCVWNAGGVGSTPTTQTCLLYTSPSPRDATLSRMPSSA